MQTNSDQGLRNHEGKNIQVDNNAAQTTTEVHTYGTINLALYGVCSFFTYVQFYHAFVVTYVYFVCLQMLFTHVHSTRAGLTCTVYILSCFIWQSGVYACISAICKSQSLLETNQRGQQVFTFLRSTNDFTTAVSHGVYYRVSVFRCSASIHVGKSKQTPESHVRRYMSPCFAKYGAIICRKHL